MNSAQARFQIPQPQRSFDADFLQQLKLHLPRIFAVVIELFGLLSLILLIAGAAILGNSRKSHTGHNYIACPSRIGDCGYSFTYKNDGKYGTLVAGIVFLVLTAAVFGISIVRKQRPMWAFWKGLNQPARAQDDYESTQKSMTQATGMPLEQMPRQTNEPHHPLGTLSPPAY